MKRFFKRIVISIISNLAHIQYLINKPFVVGITGSVGKTSTREAIFTVLSRYKKNVFQAPKNYNGEIGLPLTFLMSSSGLSNPILWCLVILKNIVKIPSNYILNLLHLRYYPQNIVAEYGIDHIGEMKDQLKIAIPNIAVVTKVALVHSQQMGDINTIVREKSKLIEALAAKSFAILNYDDAKVRSMAKHTKANVIFIGEQNKKVDVGFSDLRVTRSGIAFRVHDNTNNRSSIMQISMFGKHIPYVILPAIAVGIIFDIPFTNIINALETYKPPKGRLRVLDGIKNSIVVDGSYNASPTTMVTAIKIMDSFKEFNRVLFLGDMRELGKYEGKEHKKLTTLIAKYSDKVILVGPLMNKYTKPALVKMGYSSKNIYVTLDSGKGGAHIHNLIKNNNKKTIVVCKGSQNNIRLEKGIKLFLKSKVDAQNELARQDDQWTSKF